ncbi:unnamed protein product [Hymenolepis diminuta]|uniref:Endonuclease V n=1 Tax=Hymenolepis diminuta TaxID=6216 RepID=A0A0R3S844_HYMDI|nr:unnamed protein product [Hymenolepis diminuta]
MDEVVEQWTQEQIQLRNCCILEDKAAILEKMDNGTLCVGGLDISYHKSNSAAFVGISIVKIGNPTSNEQCETLIVDTFKVDVTVPYIPTFLAFREVPPYIEGIAAFESRHPDAPTPDIWMVDCNGTLHPRRFGGACHLGVKVGQPTFGVAKKLPNLDCAANGFPLGSNGPQKKKLVEERMSSLRKGQKLDLYGPEGTVDGVALLTSDSKSPVFVSPGHMVTLETAVEITLRCSIHRIPEPTRQVS